MFTYVYFCSFKVYIERRRVDGRQAEVEDHVQAPHHLRQCRPPLRDVRRHLLGRNWKVGTQSRYPYQVN